MLSPHTDLIPEPLPGLSLDILTSQRPGVAQAATWAWHLGLVLPVVCGTGTYMSEETF